MDQLWWTKKCMITMNKGNHKNITVITASYTGLAMCCKYQMGIINNKNVGKKIN